MNARLTKGVVFSLLLALWVAGPMVVWHRAASELERKAADLKRQTGQLEQLTAEAGRLSDEITNAKSVQALTDEQLKELLRLRSEVGQLRAQTNLIRAAREENTRLEARQTAGPGAAVLVSPEEYAAQLSTETRAAMQDLAPALGPAAQRYAMEHNQKAPRYLTDLLKYLRLTDGRPMPGVYVLEFVDGVQPLKAGPDTLVLREEQAHRLPDGKWGRLYAFGDGRIVEPVTDNGDFGAWETQHGVQKPVVTDRSGH